MFYKQHFLPIIILAVFATKIAFAADIAEVFQREYIETYQSEFMEVQTSGLNSCVGVILSTPNAEGHTILAHIDAQTDLDKEIRMLLEKFQNDDIKPIAWVYGSYKESKVNTYDKIVQYLKNSKIEIISRKQNPTSSDSFNIRFNLESKEVFFDNNLYVDIKSGIRKEKVNRIKFGKRLYRHENSAGGGYSFSPDIEDKGIIIPGSDM